MYRVGAIADLIQQHVRGDTTAGDNLKCTKGTDVTEPLNVDYKPSGTRKRKRARERSTIKKSKTREKNTSLEDFPEQDANAAQEADRDSVLVETNFEGEDSDEPTSDAPTKRASKGEESSRKKTHAEDTPEKRARTIFVGNLPATTSKKELKRLFSKYGAIEGLRFRSIAPARENFSKKVAAINRKLINENKKTVNAYVVFKEAESADAALKANASTVGTNHICVDKADSRGEVDSNKSVFVGNLPLHTTDEELWERFSQCGKVHSVRIIRDSSTGMGKGFGFVSFQGLDAVALALEMSGTDISGRRLRVMPVEKRRGSTGEKRKKRKPDSGEPSGDFQGARAERLLRKKKLKKLIKAKKKEKKAKLLFGFKTGKKVSQSEGEQ